MYSQTHQWRGGDAPVGAPPASRALSANARGLRRAVLYCRAPPPLPSENRLSATSANNVCVSAPLNSRTRRVRRKSCDRRVSCVQRASSHIGATKKHTYIITSGPYLYIIMMILLNFIILMIHSPTDNVI